MNSPFPGMDPYLEHPARWRGFHLNFLSTLMSVLNHGLPRQYSAEVEEAVRLVELDPLATRDAVPDGVVVRDPSRPRGPQTTTGGAVVLEPVPMRLPKRQEVKHRWVEIRHVPNRELVAVVELLSPTNKAEHRTDYLAKREAVLGQPVHLLELDLLLGGKRLPMEVALPPGDYYAFVSRHYRRPDADVYHWFLRDPLPAVPLPLVPPDGDFLIDLAAVVRDAYDRCGYERVIDYSEPPTAPIRDVDLPWVAETARAGTRA